MLCLDLRDAMTVNDVLGPKGCYMTTFSNPCLSHFGKQHIFKCSM